jgi:transcriptional regulator with GAF, ATPase, and Fis domain
MNIFKSYYCPGNIRELENIVERCVIFSESTNLFVDKTQLQRKNTIDDKGCWKSLDEVEREYIINVLETTGWIISGENGAGHLLKMHPNTLRWRIKKLEIKKP